MTGPVGDELRLLLWETAARGDAKALETLCRASREAIVQTFPAWRIVPESIRDLPKEAEAYIQAMFAVARVFEKWLQDPSLMQILAGKDQDNPLVRWQQTLEKAQKEMDSLHYEESAHQLNDLLIDVHSLRGSGADILLPITYGLLAECYFQSGAADRAVNPAEKAVDLCQRIDDLDGAITHLGNLYEIQRYCGESERAAQAAEEIAELLEQQDQEKAARRQRQQAARVRAGEPLVRIVCQVEGEKRELEEVLESIPKKIEFGHERNRLTLSRASHLTIQGDQLARQSRLDSARNRYQQAALADPFDPQCHYGAGIIHLQLGRFGSALEEFQQVERLAPGWFQCRSFSWLAEQMQRGTVSKETFSSWYQLETGDLANPHKLTLLDKALKTAPEFAPLYALKGRVLRRLEQQAAAAEAMGQGLPFAAEPDLQTRLLVDLADVTADRMRRRQLLRDAIELGGNLLAVATARLLLAFGD